MHSPALMLRDHVLKRGPAGPERKQPGNMLLGPAAFPFRVSMHREPSGRGGRSQGKESGCLRPAPMVHGEKHPAPTPALFRARKCFILPEGRLRVVPGVQASLGNAGV